MKHPQHLLKLSLNLFVLFHIFSLIIFVLYYCLFVGLFDCFSNIWPSCLCSCFCQGTYLVSQGKSTNLQLLSDSHHCIFLNDVENISSDSALMIFTYDYCEILLHSQYSCVKISKIYNAYI